MSFFDTIKKSFGGTTKSSSNENIDYYFDIIFNEDKLGMVLKDAETRINSAVTSKPIVKSVVTNSPAANKGIRIGDVVIKLEGNDVNTFEDFQTFVIALGRPITVRLIRFFYRPKSLTVEKVLPDSPDNKQSEDSSFQFYSLSNSKSSRNQTDNNFSSNKNIVLSEEELLANNLIEEVKLKTISNKSDSISPVENYFLDLLNTKSAKEISTLLNAVQDIKDNASIERSNIGKDLYITAEGELKDYIKEIEYNQISDPQLVEKSIIELSAIMERLELEYQSVKEKKQCLEYLRDKKVIDTQSIQQTLEYLYKASLKKNGITL